MDTRARRHAVVRALGGEVPDPGMRLPGWTVEGDSVHLPYELEGLGRLTETVRFPGRDLEGAAARPQTAGALQLLYLCAATSYAKAVLPSRIELPPVPPAAVTMLRALLTDGLAEFAVHNGLFPLPVPELGFEAAPELPDQAPAEGVVVPIGGGKDSAVTASLAVRAGWDAVGFAVNPRPSMRRTAAAVGLPLLTAERRLDPTLLAWNAAGAFNGHVPITAIVASIACVAATLDGRGDVLLSNESSADEPTRVVDGREVNHQYSKSSAFELLHTAAARALTGGATRALSILRPLPELVVAGLFASLGAPLDAVNSCNLAYTLTGATREWCGRCPKCLFVQLMLAPFTDPADFRAATGFDALAREDAVDDLGALRDPERKPFECVGTVAEVQLAFDLLASDPRWSSHAAVAAHGTAATRPTPRERFTAMLRSVDTSTLPPRYAAPLTDALEQLRSLDTLGGIAT